ncbi:MAG: D-inositol 3-phosphate glycosyltransferase [Bacteroidetes bacterium ADurb.Bin408]|nr:MAG: D-inositol 3-phosphate glycosyltransferase [Bacteroidetes bacterium ADurb.Bin408]
MNIVVNTQLLLKNKLEGLGWFTYETLKRITAAHPEHTFYFIFDRPYDFDFIFGPNVKPVIMRPASRHPLLWYLRFEILLPRLLRKLGADVYLSPDGWSTLGTSLPCVQVIHDINYEHYPANVPFAIRHYFKYFFPRYARKAQIVATVSEYSKQDIMKTYGLPENKIQVIYNGCNEAYRPLDEDTNTLTRLNCTGGKPYFLYVGALLPRKNISRLFEAFDVFKQTDKQDIKLVIVGEKMWWTKEIARSFENMQYRDDVIFLGRLETEHLCKVYSAALALSFVPYFEGFGIPIIEAFSCGVPVITSNCTSMPEIAADAALLVNPFDVEEIAAAMGRIATDNALRAQLVEKGYVRRQDFSWDKTAAALWACVINALQKDVIRQDG